MLIHNFEIKIDVLYDIYCMDTLYKILDIGTNSNVHAVKMYLYTYTHSISFISAVIMIIYINNLVIIRENA